MELKVGVKGILKNKEGNVLLLRRSDRNLAALAGQWDLPGGRIEEGSSLFENLKREVMEETQLELIEEPKLIAAQDIIDEVRHLVRLTYVGEVEGSVRLSEEHTEYGWFTKEEIKEFDEELDRFTREIIYSATIWES